MFYPNFPPVTNIFIKVYEVDPATADVLDTQVQLLKSIADVIHLRVLKEVFHKFETIGVTGTLLLQQSHISVHTYPEHKFLVIDIFSDSKYGTEEEQKIREEIQKIYPSSVIDITTNS
jgi:S-adenosylmethionine/arginine decarboxylase-like enzyme